MQFWKTMFAETAKEKLAPILSTENSSDLIFSSVHMIKCAQNWGVGLHLCTFYHASRLLNSQGTNQGDCRTRLQKIKILLTLTILGHECVILEETVCGSNGIVAAKILQIISTANINAIFIHFI